MRMTSWHRLDRWNVVLVLISASLLALWLAIPSQLFLRAISLTVEGEQVRFIRQVPYGSVTARWFTEITLENGFTCTPGDWQVSHYETIPGDTVTFPLWDWARPCVHSGQPYYMTTTRVVLLGGFLPLRASRIATGPILPEAIPRLPPQLWPSGTFGGAE